MKTKSAIPSVLIATLLVLTLPGCESGESGGGVLPVPDLLMGQTCAPSAPEDCPSRLCLDAVSGTAWDGGTSSNYSNPAIEGTICTTYCASDSDCQGLAFASVNGLQVATETWSCWGGACGVHVTPPSSNMTRCERCLQACRGLPGCCMGEGCICESDC